MMITDNRGTDKVLEDLDTGTIFMYKGTVYMKCHNYNTECLSEWIDCVICNTGDFTCISPDAKVRALNARLVIEDWLY